MCAAYREEKNGASQKVMGYKIGEDLTEDQRKELEAVIQEYMKLSCGDQDSHCLWAKTLFFTRMERLGLVVISLLLTTTALSSNVPVRHMNFSTAE